MCPFVDSVSLFRGADTVTDFSWEPRGERFAIVSSSDPNLGNPGPGITIKTDVSFYQLERGKGDFKLLSTCRSVVVKRKITRSHGLRQTQKHCLHVLAIRFDGHRVDGMLSLPRWVHRPSRSWSSGI